MQSFLEVAPDSDFTIHNIPFGVYKLDDYTGACTRIGDTIVDLAVCQNFGI